MAKKRGSSSPSTKPTARDSCPLCGKGHLDTVVTTHELRGVTIHDLLLDRCDSCGELIWPLGEVERARRVASLKIKTGNRAA